ncbi:MAG: cation-translocating P-type ATPase, partial [candidate division Zixibacteria bacterium]|nr:cation-translocating P-type ATPase [candidate division Zixibacteria bacterium]
MNETPPDKITFPVIGFKEKTDADKLVERLKRLPGLLRVSAAAGDGTVSLMIADPRRRNEAIAAIIAEIGQSGLSVRTVSVDVDILNMRCAGCVATLENGLKKIPGITGVQINFATQVGRVDLVDGLYDRNRLLDDIKSVGYEAVFHIDDRAEDRKDAVLRRDLALAVACTSVIFVLHMGQHLFRLFTIDHTVSAVIQLILTLPVLYAGRMFFADAIERLRHLQTDMNSLIALGSGSAFVYSLAVTLPMLIGNGNHMSAVYYETTAMILTFILIGKYLEARATREARDAATGMSELIPRRVTRVTESGTEEEIAIGDLRLGDTVIVRPG